VYMYIYTYESRLSINSIYSLSEIEYLKKTGGADLQQMTTAKENASRNLIIVRVIE
jgi:hypothetical protein